MRLIATAAVAALALTLSGCGDNDDKNDEPKVVEIDLKDVLLDKKDLADQFVVSDDDDDEDGPDLGCFSDVDSLGDNAEERLKQGYEIPGETGFPVIELTASRYKTMKELEEQFADVVEQLDECDSFKVDEDGIVLDMDVDSDDDITVDDVDGQITIDLTGTMTVQGQSIPMAVSMRGVFLDGYFTGAMFGDLGDLSQANPGAVADVLIEAQAERLVAAIEGDELPEREDLELVDAYVS